MMGAKGRSSDPSAQERSVPADRHQSDSHHPFANGGRCILSKSPTRVRRLEPSGLVSMGSPRKWGSSGNRRWWGYVVRWMKLLSEVETERAIVDGATNLKQEVCAAS